jgi:hypothetical protein
MTMTFGSNMCTILSGCFQKMGDLTRNVYNEHLSTYIYISKI